MAASLTVYYGKFRECSWNRCRYGSYIRFHDSAHSYICRGTGDYGDAVLDELADRTILSDPYEWWAQAVRKSDGSIRFYRRHLTIVDDYGTVKYFSLG